MGGKVFATGPSALFTPRMIPEVYNIAHSNITNALKPLFPNLKSPLIAPDKASFGDVDIILSLEGTAFTETEIKDPQRTSIWAAVQKALGSVHVQKAPVFSSFAVSWPDVNATVWTRQLALIREERHKAWLEGEAESKNEPKHEAVDVQDCSVQVDVETVCTNRELEWKAL